MNPFYFTAITQNLSVASGHLPGGPPPYLLPPGAETMTNPRDLAGSPACLKAKGSL